MYMMLKETVQHDSSCLAGLLEVLVIRLKTRHLTLGPCGRQRVRKLDFLVHYEILSNDPMQGKLG